MVRQRLGLTQIEAKQIYLVCSLQENAERLSQAFVEQGFECKLARDSQDMYRLLCDNPPGYVLISNELASGMGKLLPDFVMKRFGLPVLLVREHDQAPTLPSAASLPIGIQPVESCDPGEMLQAVRNFEALTQERLEGRSPKPSANEAPVRTGPRLVEKVVASLREAFIEEPLVLAPDAVLTLHACRISDEQGESCVLLGFPSGEGVGELAEAMVIIETRVKEIAGADASLEKITDQMTRADFERLVQNASNRVQGKLAERELIIVHFESVEWTEEMISLQESEMVTLVPLEAWWTELSLPCHAYLWMPTNKRRVLYVRPGQTLRAEAFERFASKGQFLLAVDPADYEQFRRWRNLIRSLRRENGAARKLASGGIAPPKAA